MPATGDRVPCVYVENHRVVGLDPNDPLKVSFGESHRRRTHRARKTRSCSRCTRATGTTLPSSMASAASVIMTGGKSARWDDDDNGRRLCRAGECIHRAAQGRAVLSLLFDARYSCAARSASAVRRQEQPWARAAMRSSNWTGAWASCSLPSSGTVSRKRRVIIFSSDNGPVVDDGYKDEAKETDRRRTNLRVHGAAGSTASSKAAHACRSSSDGPVA